MDERDNATGKSPRQRPRIGVLFGAGRAAARPRVGRNPCGERPEGASPELTATRRGVLRSSAVAPRGALGGTEKAVSDVKVQHKQALSRQEAARLIATLAEGLGEDGKVTVRLGSSTLELSVASQLDCELEVGVDGDEIELELELKWSTSGRASAEAAEGGSVGRRSVQRRCLGGGRVGAGRRGGG